MRNRNGTPIMSKEDAANLKEAHNAKGIQYFEYLYPTNSNDVKSESAYWLSIKWK